MALVELERLAIARAVFRRLAGEGLDRRGRQAAEHLGQVRAPLYAAENLAHTAAEILDQTQADELRVGRL